jgi:hypothetical protein
MRASNLFEEDAILEIIEYGTFPKCSFPEYQQLPYLRTGTTMSLTSVKTRFCENRDFLPYRFFVIALNLE